MIYFEGVKIPAFDIRTTFARNTSVCSDKHNNLLRAISRSKAAGSDRNYKIGERIDKLKTEYHRFSENSLFICEDNDKFVFCIILHGSLLDVTSDIENTNLKLFLSKTHFVVF